MFCFPITLSPSAAIFAVFDITSRAFPALERNFLSLKFSMVFSSMSSSLVKLSDVLADSRSMENSLRFPSSQLRECLSRLLIGFSFVLKVALLYTFFSIRLADLLVKLSSTANATTSKRNNAIFSLILFFLLYQECYLQSS